MSIVHKLKIDHSTNSTRYISLGAKCGIIIELDGAPLCMVELILEPTLSPVYDINITWRCTA